MSDKLAAATHMGAVTLKVGDLDAMIRYYTEAVPLQLLSHAGPTATLGRGGVPVLVLVHTPELRHAASGQAGLYHTAILFETETALASAVASVARRAPGTFTGSADHLVSKAFYFTDPEGNGVELYWDRARTQWSWTHGQVEMDTLFLDPNQFLREHLSDPSTEPDSIRAARVGHVHLSVGDVSIARDFYVDRLGFDATLDFHGSALFVSAGGYHHHMAMNVWNSRGAGRRQPALGLGEVNLLVPSSDDLGALDERMRHHGVDVADDGATLTFEDPWANSIRVALAA
ncbi:MAG: VOC family protein [Microbacterium sp.]|jgi:catechol 2,3-dioxygenase|uniref:VOC family protein n=1 Tax=unclassified Microbacterium TaxID=2609290 RepID=UPI0025DF8100|nr:MULTISPECIES: VOC family protein [unclassified Microbacterium]MEC8761184.1 VOC family protein [Actinomycetota bacterium]|tara:strand:- start:122 stop:982 length:861 start_codon:yes stop_codon:yes gene_type:complete